MMQTESPAIVAARAHVEAWSNHDFETARSGLAPNVEVRATTTNPFVPDTNLTGIDAYMQGLIAFAQGIVPGSARVIASAGDERNALLMLTVQMTGPDGTPRTLSGARLYLLDGSGRIEAEQVVFYVEG